MCTPPRVLHSRCTAEVLHSRCTAEVLHSRGAAVCWGGGPDRSEGANALGAPDPGRVGCAAVAEEQEPDQVLRGSVGAEVRRAAAGGEDLIRGWGSVRPVGENLQGGRQTLQRQTNVAKPDTAGKRKAGEAGGCGGKTREGEARTSTPRSRSDCSISPLAIDGPPPPCSPSPSDA